MDAVVGVPEAVVSAVAVADGNVVTLTGPPINFNRIVWINKNLKILSLYLYFE